MPNKSDVLLGLEAGNEMANSWRQGAINQQLADSQVRAQQQNADLRAGEMELEKRRVEQAAEYQRSLMGLNVTIGDLRRAELDAVRAKLENRKNGLELLAQFSTELSSLQKDKTGFAFLRSAMESQAKWQPLFAHEDPEIRKQAKALLDSGKEFYTNSQAGQDQATAVALTGLGYDADAEIPGSVDAAKGLAQINALREFAGANGIDPDTIGIPKGGGKRGGGFDDAWMAMMKRKIELKASEDAYKRQPVKSSMSVEVTPPDPTLGTPGGVKQKSTITGTPEAVSAQAARFKAAMGVDAPPRIGEVRRQNGVLYRWDGKQWVQQ